MKTCKGYYNSPIGMIEIESDGSAVTSLSFCETNDTGSYTPADTCPIITQCIKQLDEYFSSVRKSFDIPVELKGTTFQKKVWKNLSEIGYGKTVSYQDIAAKSGNIKACRAAGAAIGANPVPIIVPCHRVVGKNGKLTGFACGIERKKWLLEHEKAGT